MKTQGTHDGQPLPNIWVKADGIDVSAAGFVFVDGAAVTCPRCGGMVHRSDIEGYGFELGVVEEEDFDTLCGNCLDADSRLLTATEAAERLGRHPSLIRRYCNEGRLRALRVGRDWVIVASDLEAFAQQERKVGRPLNQTSHVRLV